MGRCGRAGAGASSRNKKHRADRSWLTESPVTISTTDRETSSLYGSDQLHEVYQTDQLHEVYQTDQLHEVYQTDQLHEFTRRTAPFDWPHILGAQAVWLKIDRAAICRPLSVDVLSHASVHANVGTSMRACMRACVRAFIRVCMRACRACRDVRDVCIARTHVDDDDRHTSGHSCVGHHYIDQNYIGHDYIRHNYTGHNYIGHNCTSRTYRR